MGTLPGWNKRLKLTIDQTKIDTANQENFPVLAYLSAASGITSADVSCIFDELDYPSVDDAFTGANGSAPNSDLWDVISTNGFTIQGNRLSNVAGAWEFIRSRWRLSGDFDIQVDFDASNAPTTDGWYSRIHLCSSDSSIKQFMAINYTGGYKYASNYYDSGWGSEQKVTTTDTTGKFRIARVGNTITCYTWNGSGWDSRLAHTYSSAPDITVGLINSFPSGSTTFYHDNFIVNSGSFIWPQKTHPNRKKIALTTSDGVTQCYTEIERWDDANEKAWLWVKVPSAAYNADTDLYLYYDKDHADNTTYVGDTESTPARSVWDANFVFVGHMGQDPNGDPADAIKDSTTNANHGTPGGSMTSADLVDGKIGKALDYDGDDYVTIGADGSLKFGTGDFTIESIVRTSSSAAQALLSYGDRSDGPGWDAFIGANGVAKFIIDDGTTQVILEDVVDHADGSFHSSAVVMDRNGNGIIYIDGLAVDTRDISSANLTLDTIDHDDIEIARTWITGTYQFPFTGALDEVRISNIVRAAPWIKATYHSNWDSLITFGAEETLTTNLFDGKVKIKDSTTDLFDGKVRIKDSTTDLFDGKAVIAICGTDLFDGKVKVKDSATNLFDGKVILTRVTTDLFDGKVRISRVAHTDVDSGVSGKGYSDVDSGVLGAPVLQAFSGIRGLVEDLTIKALSGIKGIFTEESSIESALAGLAKTESSSGISGLAASIISSGIIGGVADVFGFSYPLADPMPLRNTTIWGSFKNVQTIHHAYGRVRLAPIPYEKTGKFFVMADHGIQGVDAIEIDDTVTYAWKFTNTLDSSNSPVAMLELGEALPEGSSLIALIRGKVHPLTGVLLTSPADIIWDILANIAGAPVAYSDLDKFRVECAIYGIEIHGLLDDRTRSIKKQLDLITESIGAIWSGGMPGLARIYPVDE